MNIFVIVFLIVGCSKEKNTIKDLLLKLNDNVESSVIEDIYSSDLNKLKSISNLSLYVNVKDKPGYNPLLKAVSEGHEDIVKFLLVSGADINAKNIDDETALVKAADKGNTKIVEILINNKANVNINIKNGKTALCKAIKKGHLEIVKLLLNAGADVNAKSEYGKTALIESVLYNRVEIVKLLLNAGADADIENSNNQTGLIIAAQKGYLEIVRLLLDAGADVNVKNKYKETALITAVQTGNVEIVRLLLDAGADFNIENNNKETGFIIAVQTGNVEIVRLLLDAGADVNTENKYKEIALIIAVQKGYLEIVKSLLDAGADVNVKNNNKETGLIIAVQKGNVKIVKSLLDAGANVNAKNKHEETALIIALQIDNVEIVRLLLNAGADVNVKNKHEETALIIAVKKENFLIVKLLLNAGADVNAKNKHEETGLIIAVQKDNVAIVKLLLNAGADINHKSKYFGSALIESVIYNRVRYNSVRIVKLLLDAGADVNSVGSNGETALYKIVRNSNINAELLELLISKGADVNILNNNSESLLEVASQINKEEEKIAKVKVLLKYMVISFSDLNKRFINEIKNVIYTEEKRSVYSSYYDIEKSKEDLRSIYNSKLNKINNGEEKETIKSNMEKEIIKNKLTALNDLKASMNYDEMNDRYIKSIIIDLINNGYVYAVKNILDTNNIENALAQNANNVEKASKQLPKIPLNIEFKDKTIFEYIVSKYLATSNAYSQNTIKRVEHNYKITKISEEMKKTLGYDDRQLSEEEILGLKIIKNKYKELIDIILNNTDTYKFIKSEEDKNNIYLSRYIDKLLFVNDINSLKNVLCLNKITDLKRELINILKIRDNNNMSIMMKLLTHLDDLYNKKKDVEVNINGLIQETIEKESKEIEDNILQMEELLKNILSNIKEHLSEFTYVDHMLDNILYNISREEEYKNKSILIEAVMEISNDEVVNLLLDFMDNVDLTKEDYLGFTLNEINNRFRNGSIERLNI
jgi:ankyrin repeat protein